MVIKINYTSSDVYVSTSVSPVYVVVNYSAVNNGGGGAIWGGITGTLSDQTDLQDALDDKVPYTGATGQVDLGNYDLKVQGLTIGKGNNSLVNNTALGHSTLLTATTGNYNTAVGYESLRNTTTGQYNTAVGQSSLFSNTTGSQNTALGLNALLSNTTASSNVAVGLDTLQHITTGSSNTAIGYNAGSHITGGSTPNTTATNSVFIGRDSKANADGQTNQIVIGQNAVGNGSNTATFGNTATTANYFTGSINGGSFVKSGGTSSQFLKADGSVDSTTYVGGSGTSGQVAYWNGTSSQTGSNNLFWDAANARLGIGTNAPAYNLHLNGSMRIGTSGASAVYWDDINSRLGVGTNAPNVRLHVSGDFQVSTASTKIADIGNFSGTGAISRLFGTSAGQLSGAFYFDGSDQNNSAYGAFGVATSGSYFGTTGAVIFASSRNGTGTQLPMSFGGFSGSWSTWMQIKTNGNVLVGTTTDGGQRLQVIGDAFIKGSGATSNALTIQNSAGSAVFTARGDTRLTLGGIVDIGLTNSAFNAYSSTFNTLGIIPSAGWTNEGIGVWVFDRAASSTSGALRQIRFGGIGSGFAPSSGTATHTHLEINSTINQTGGANGITRGLYVNPTLTAAADWRSIEWSNNSGWGLYGAGTAPNFLGGNTTISRNQNDVTSLTISNTTSGISAQSYLNLISNASSGNFAIQKASSLTSSYKIFLANDGLIYNGTAGDIAILNDVATGKIKFAAGASSTAQMTLTAAGRLLLGTTTESTFMLDVNGTARVSGATTISAATTGTSGYSLSISDTNSSIGANILLQFGGNGTIFRAAALGARIISTGGSNFLGLVNSSGNVNIGADENATSPNKLNIHVNSSSVDGQGISLIDTGGSGNVGAGINYFGGSTTLMASIRTRIQSGYLNSVLAFSTNNASNVLTERFRITETGNVLVGSTTNVPSAILAADSTTKGFLPPRMTTTQKNAISSPAAGLQVYDTTLNQMSYYNGTTWVNF